MTTLRKVGSDLARAVDRLASRIERQTLPESAAELDQPELSATEALTLAIFAEAGPGTGVESREEKIALAGVIARRAKRTKRADWQGAVAQLCPSIRGERWRQVGALLFNRPGLLQAGAERSELQGQRRRLKQKLQQSSEIARLTLAGELPANMPGADRFATESEIAFAKADGRVTPGTLVQYGAHWFYKARARRARGTSPRHPRRKIRVTRRF